MKQRLAFYVLDWDTDEKVGGPYDEREPAERKAKQLNKVEK
jgi:hypothetical protein